MEPLSLITGLTIGAAVGSIAGRLITNRDLHQRIEFHKARGDTYLDAYNEQVARNLALEAECHGLATKLARIIRPLKAANAKRQAKAAAERHERMEAAEQRLDAKEAA